MTATSADRAIGTESHVPVTTAFRALLARDLYVLRHSLNEFIPRTVLQPLLLVFVFTYVFPKIGQGIGGGGEVVGVHGDAEVFGLGEVHAGERADAAEEDIDHATGDPDLHMPLRPHRLSADGLVVEIENDGVLSICSQDSGLVRYLTLEGDVERRLRRAG